MKKKKKKKILTADWECSKKERQTGLEFLSLSYDTVNFRFSQILLYPMITLIHSTLPSKQEASGSMIPSVSDLQYVGKSDAGLFIWRFALVDIWCM
jgi:hypothetical protein